MDDLRVTLIDASVGNDYTVSLCPALSAAGVSVELVAPENRVVQTPLSYTILRWMPSKDPRVGKARKTARYLEYLARVLLRATDHNRQKQIMHFQFFRRERVESIFFPLLSILDPNLVFTAHNVLPHENNRVDHILRAAVYRSAKSIIVHSEYIKRKLATDFQVSPDKIHVIPCGNLHHFLPGRSPSKAEARQALNLSDGDHVVLFFGYIREYKGLDLLLDAFEICVRTDRQLKLVIAGAPRTPALEMHYRSRIAAISDHDSIRFDSGFVPSDLVATYFVASDAVILPYRDSDHSGIFHLASSFARPLIATQVGDFPEVIEDGVSGYLLKENTADCLAETMLMAFSHQPTLETMGAYARELSETKYSWADIARQTSDLYTSLVQARQSPAF